MKLTSKPLAIIILVILFGGILLSTALNWWQTESTKQPARIKDGEFAGQPDPADIRGSYTFGDIQSNFGIPLEDLAVAFALPEGTDVAAFGVKNLEEMYSGLPNEIGTSSVRWFTALYAGLPYDFEEDIYLLQPAVDILKQKATLSDEQIVYLDAHVVALSEVGSAPTPVVEATLTEEEHTTSEDTTIKGKTTFQEVLNWGVPQEKIEEIIGGPMPNPLTKVKDYCTEKGLAFETIKTALQAEIAP